MKAHRLIVMLAFLFSADCFAAKCKVDGVWYDYDSPQCSPDRKERNHSKPTTAAPSPSVVGKGEETWADVKPKALKICEKKHDSYSLQAACMRNEERGYNQFQGSFGMPPKAEITAKMACYKKHDVYSLRAACMRNEQRGYEQLHEK